MAALGEIVEQMRTRARLEAAGVRLEARAQRYLTALERLHVTLIQNDSLTSSDATVHVALDDLARLTEEVHWKNLSLDELVGSGEGFDAPPEASAGADLESLLDQIESLTGVMREAPAAPAAVASAAPAATSAAAPSPAAYAATPPAPAATSGIVLGTSADEQVVFAPSGADGTDGTVDESEQEAQRVQRSQR